MFSRHDEIQPMTVRRGRTVDAKYYNHVQTALKKLGPELRFRLPKMKHLDLIVQKNAWIVVDRVLNDIPVVAWTDFEVEHRSNLHEPIACEVRSWHFAASMVMNRALEAMDLMLEEELHELESDADGVHILKFPEKK